MESIFSYLLEVNLILIILFAAFWWIARNETFHQLNRAILLGIVICSFSLPLINFPAITIEKPSWLPFLNEVSVISAKETASEGVIVNGFFAEEGTVTAIPDEKEAATGLLNFNPWIILLIFYFSVTSILLLRVFRQLWSLYRLLNAGRHYWDEGIIQVHLQEKISPFSFFHWVFFNPDQIKGEQRKMILEHERVHAHQLHNIDILLGELYVAFLWFNPLVWKLKQIINQNLEYIADEEMIRNGVDRKNYQYSLLSLNAPLSRIPVANHFNYSLIKNRIHMMNIKKSPDHRLLKYMLFFPLLISFLLLSNLSYAQSKEKAKPKIEAKETRPEKSKVKPKAEAKETQPEKAAARSKAAAAEVESSITARPVITTTQSVGINDAVDSGRVVVVGTAVNAQGIGTAKVTGVTISAEQLVAEENGVTVGVIKGRKAEGDAVEVTAVENVTVAGVMSKTKPVGTISKVENVEEVAIANAEFVERIGANSPDFKIPVKEGENVFLAIRYDMSQKTLNEIKPILKEHGIDATFNDVEFDGNGNLTRIHVKVKVGDQYHGSMLGYNDGRPLEKPIILYVMKDGTEKFGISKGMPQEIPSKVRRNLDRLTGLLIIQGSENYIKGRLELRNAH